MIEMPAAAGRLHFKVGSSGFLTAAPQADHFYSGLCFFVNTPDCQKEKALKG